MLIILFVIVVHEILCAKGPVVTARTYPYQPNGNGFKGAIPRVTLLALQKTTPDRNADRLPMPGVLRELTQLHVVRGPCSFDDLKTVEACMSSGGRVRSTT